MRKLHSLTILLACALATAAGCGGRSKVAAPPVSQAPTTTVVPTTLPPQTPTTIAALPNTTGTDLVLVMRNLDQLLNLVAQTVDLSMLDLIYVPGSDPRKVAEQQLRQLQDNGWHYDPESKPSTIADITVVKTPIEGVVIVDLTSSLETQVVKDASGQVVKTGDGWSPRRERYGLFRGGDGRWRIQDFSILGPAI